MKNQILVCTHGRFGEEMIRSAEMIIGPMEHAKAFSLLPGMDPFEYRQQIQDYVEEQEDTAFLCLADLYGGSPSNMLASLCGKDNIEVVSGLNLPMLIEAYSQLEVLEPGRLKEEIMAAHGNSCVDVKEKLMETLRNKEG